MSDLGNRQIMAENIKYFMKKKGVSRKELSGAISVPYTTVSDWINGKTYPRIDKIELMSNFFNVEKKDLVERRNPKATQFGDHDENMKELHGDSELLNKYLELIQDEQVGVLFDKVGKLTPKQLKAVLAVIDAIYKEEE